MGGKITTLISQDQPSTPQASHNIFINVLFCRTNVQGACLAPPVSPLEVTLEAGEVATVTAFVEGSGEIPVDPARNRIPIRFLASSLPLSGALVGLTSVAVRKDVTIRTPPLCGDTTGPGGTRVACACGNIVTTNTTLQKSDPVVSTALTDFCGGHGLFVQTGVTLDCNKWTLRGAGAGWGVLFFDDERYSGPVAAKHCTIKTFSIGIEIRDWDLKNSLIESNTVVENVGTGIDGLYGEGGTVRKNEIGNNGGHGFSCDDGFTHLVFTKNQVFGNAGNGIVLREDPFHTVTGNVVEDNGQWGIVLEGVHGVTVTNNDVRHNSGGGIMFKDEVSNGLLARNVVSDNGGAGISVAMDYSGTNTIIANRGKRNAGNGLEVISRDAQSHFIADNEFNHNGRHGICATPTNIDGGGNQGKNNALRPDATFNDGC